MYVHAMACVYWPTCHDVPMEIRGHVSGDGSFFTPCVKRGIKFSSPEVVASVTD